MDGIYEVNEFMNQREALNIKERMYPIARTWNDFTSVMLFESYLISHPWSAATGNCTQVITDIWKVSLY